LFRDGELVGLGAGVRSPCRLSFRPVHVYLPTTPAIPEPDLRDEGLDALVETLAGSGAVAVSLDSYDAGWQLAKPSVTPVEMRPRREYVVPLTYPPDDMWARLATGHRRQIRRGDQEGWVVRLAAGSEAQDLLGRVQRLASERAATRGDGYRSPTAPFAGDGQDPAGTRWGSTTFIALSGTTPLAAAMVGWAGGRAFYVMGGSTLEGYRVAASIWLHWRITCRVAEARFTSYNLGGTSPNAESPQDAAHGLYRFKSGFGATVVPCCNARWSLSPTHDRLHSVGGWLGSAFGL